jgi:hypothetical protein
VGEAAADPVVEVTVDLTEVLAGVETRACCSPDGLPPPREAVGVAEDEHAIIASMHTNQNAATTLDHIDLCYRRTISSDHAITPLLVWIVSC